MLNVASRWHRAKPLVRAEIVTTSWEIFSVLLFVSAVVPAAFTAFAEGSEVLVVVRRYRRRGVKLPAVDEAYVDFDFAVTARVVVGD